MAKVSISTQAPEFTSAGIWRSCVRIMKALRTWILKF